MCGIIGYTGQKAAAPILLDALARLEYRGYDSAGIAVEGPAGSSVIVKTAGKLAALREVVAAGMPEGTTGIGHTRWATHGRPTDANSHPHADCRGNVVIVHNGIVENYVELRDRLARTGHVLASETDSECIAHLIEAYLVQEYPLEEAVARTAADMQGANAVVAIAQGEPGKIVAFRLGNAGGVVVGYGDGDMFLASDLPALLPYTRSVVYLAGGEMVSVTRREATYSRVDGTPLAKTPTHVPYDATSAVKGEFKHFMQKEIHEQPEAVVNTMRGRISFDTGEVALDGFPFSQTEVDSIERVVLIGMGTSLHAAMVGRTWMETLARLPAQYDNSSEFRYRDLPVDGRTLVVSVCQSGETADTLAAMEKAAAAGARQVTLCNYEGTQSTRIADGTVFIRAGLEIGVAASKTFTCSLVSLCLLSLQLGLRRGAIDADAARRYAGELARLPGMMGRLVANHGDYEALARELAKHANFLYLGRGINYPLAMEGALKLKEISYIHAEGYPAGEMKHGPISLIDENMPVVALVPRDSLYEKMLNNVNEVKARGGILIAVATEGDADIASRADHVIYVPSASDLTLPMLISVPMQFLAYHIAVRRGCDVDQPRNLAKSVTVE